MSNLGIFIMGAIVTSLVGGALWLLIIGAFMDGSAGGPDPPLPGAPPAERERPPRTRSLVDEPTGSSDAMQSRR
jgi:hypothetical protein